jgi:glyoxylase-like metal-dependent hydrolase (beta-lactamase superfamily II)
VETVWTKPRVIMFTAPNPGPLTLDGTHSYAVGRKPAYLIDPGPAIPDYDAFLLDWLARNGSRLQGVLLTHNHPDHSPGANRLRQVFGVPVWSAVVDATAQSSQRVLEGGDSFELDEDMLRVVSTPGHAPDHMAFWLEGTRILFAGDTILGQGSSLIAPPEGDMTAYMRSLERIRALDPRIIAPGHGPLVVEPQAKIEEYVRHREEREAQLLAALHEGPATVEELVQRVYVDVDQSLHRLAAGSVQAQLDKLRSEGRVDSLDQCYSLH